MFLNYDTCRCHDETCPDRKNCLRYLVRRTGGERTPHSDSLRPANQDEPCDSFIAFKSDGGIEQKEGKNGLDTH